MEESYSKTFMKYFHQREHAGIIESADLKSEVSNPVCGDELQLFISIDKNNIIVDAKFLTSGCASTIAIASYTKAVGSISFPCKIINRARAVIAIKSGRVMLIDC